MRAVVGSVLVAISRPSVAARPIRYRRRLSARNRSDNAVSTSPRKKKYCSRAWASLSASPPLACASYNALDLPPGLQARCRGRPCATPGCDRRSTGSSRRPSRSLTRLRTPASKSARLTSVRMRAKHDAVEVRRAVAVERIKRPGDAVEEDAGALQQRLAGLEFKVLHKVGSRGSVGVIRQWVKLLRAADYCCCVYVVLAANPKPSTGHRSLAQGRATTDRYPGR